MPGGESVQSIIDGRFFPDAKVHVETTPSHDPGLRIVLTRRAFALRTSGCDART